MKQNKKTSAVLSYVDKRTMRTLAFLSHLVLVVASVGAVYLAGNEPSQDNDNTRNKRTVDPTLARLGDLQPLQTGILNLNFIPLSDCQAIYELNGLRVSGYYSINPDGNGDFVVYCDMSQLDGVYNGWTVIQRRINGSTDFNRLWSEYKIGFGNLSTNLWLGLEKIRRITNSASYKLYVAIQFQDVDVAAQGGQSVRFAEYNVFKVGAEVSNYQLLVDSYNSAISTAGDSLISIHNGKYFSTRDRDNDNSPPNCAGDYQSGWWFNGCLDSNLNGVWQSTGYVTNTPAYFGVSWKTGEPFQTTYSFKTSVIAIRRN